MKTEKILIGEIAMNEDRTEGGKGDIESLARNMAKYGQINAVTVVEDISNSYRYRIIAGRRRCAAAESLGWTEIRADVYGSDELGADSEEMIALSENAAREEMNAIDEGVLYAKELAKGTPVEELAALFCRNKSTVYQRAKLARLVPEMRELYKAGRVSLHVAAMASDLPEEAQKKIADKGAKITYGTYAISEWDIKGEIRNASNDFLHCLGNCEECVACSKRTHFSDKTLFPELAESDDRCLDHSCYCKKFQARIESAFTEFSERERGKPEVDSWDGSRIVTTETIPEGIKVSGLEITEIEDDEDDLGNYDTYDEDDVRIKNQLEAESKVEWVPCWNGTDFEFVELAKRSDIDALYYKNDEKEDQSESWQEKRKSKLSDIFRAVPEEKLSEILADDKQYWAWEDKAGKIFEEKLRTAVSINKDDEKILVTEQIALLVLLYCSVKEIKEALPDAKIADDDSVYSVALYEKLLTQRRGDMLRLLLKSFLSGYKTKPHIDGLDNSDWQKIFVHLDVDLTKLRDEAALESIKPDGQSDNAAETSESDEPEDVSEPDEGTEADEDDFREYEDDSDESTDGDDDWSDENIVYES